MQHGLEVFLHLSIKMAGHGDGLPRASSTMYIMLSGVQSARRSQIYHYFRNGNSNGNCILYILL